MDKRDIRAASMLLHAVSFLVLLIVLAGGARFVAPIVVLVFNAELLNIAYAIVKSGKERARRREDSSQHEDLASDELVITDGESDAKRRRRLFSAPLLATLFILFSIVSVSGAVSLGRKCDLERLLPVEKHAFKTLNQKSSLGFSARVVDPAERDDQDQRIYRVTKLKCRYGLEDSDVELFSNFNRLQSLKLMNCRISSKGLGELCQALPDGSRAVATYDFPLQRNFVVSIDLRSPDSVKVFNSQKGMNAFVINTFDTREEAQEYLESLPIEDNQLMELM